MYSPEIQYGQILREVHIMTAYNASMNQQSGHCASAAAACTSARICCLMDTVIVAVSIIILVSLRIIALTA